MSIVYLKQNGVIAIPVMKIDGVRWDEYNLILQVQVGHLVHSITWDSREDGCKTYETIIKKIEDFYNLRRGEDVV